MTGHDFQIGERVEVLMPYLPGGSQQPVAVPLFVSATVVDVRPCAVEVVTEEFGIPQWAMTSSVTLPHVPVPLPGVRAVVGGKAGVLPVNARGAQAPHLVVSRAARGSFRQIAARLRQFGTDMVLDRVLQMPLGAASAYAELEALGLIAAYRGEARQKWHITREGLERALARDDGLEVPTEEVTVGSRRVNLGGEALHVMRGIAVLYREKNFPNHKAWWFQPAEGERPVFNELEANDLVERRGMGPNPNWGLTDLGKQLILQGNLGLDDAEEKPATITTKADPRNVFIIHGRNHKARDEMEKFLRAAGLTPLRFQEVRGKLGGNATTLDVVNKGLADAHVVIALITPDELAALRGDYRRPKDDQEHRARWQARPNVIFEAGMAYAMKPDRTFFVLIGDPKLFTDVQGISYIVPDNDPERGRGELFDVLKNARCSVAEGRAWMSKMNGDFERCFEHLGDVSEHDPFGESRPAKTTASRKLRSDPNTFRMEFDTWLSGLTGEESRKTHYYDDLDEKLGFTEGSTKTYVQTKMPRSGEGWIVTDLSNDGFKDELKYTLRGGGLRDFGDF